MQTMKKAQIYLPEEQWLELKYLASKQNTSVASLIRQTVTQLLKSQRQRKRPASWADLASKISRPLGKVDIDREVYET